MGRWNLVSTRPEGRVEAMAVDRLVGAVEEVTSDAASCAKDPTRDFTRNRKIPLPRVLWTIICWGQDTVGIELLDAVGRDGETPKASALCQQLSKLGDDVMPRVNGAFLSRCPVVPYAREFRAYGVDGTDVQLPPSMDPRTRVRSGTGDSEHNECHPTCMYDLARETFEDMVWQGSKEQNEPEAFCELVDRTDPGTDERGRPLTALFLGDRNYTSYNTIHHLLEAGASFVLRGRDDWVERLVGEDKLPKGEFDVTIERILVRTRSTKSRTRPDEPEIYRQINHDTKLDAIPRGSRGEWPVTLRIVRKRVRGRDGDRKRGHSKSKWLNIVTNLTDTREYTAEWLARTYKLRWGHEVGYRHLKHAVGALVPKTRDYDRARTEFWGRLILYNACSVGSSRALARGGRKGRKHVRPADVTTAFKGMMRILRGIKVRLEEVCAKNTHVAEPGRHFARKEIRKSNHGLGYRHS